MEKRITVLMGIYNCAPTLAEALDSLVAQTYQGFKVVLCDDGSTDNTVEVAQQYVDRYPDQFMLIRNERNMGLNYTLNHCLEYADTEYCARMDGDDISLPTRFDEEINFLDAHLEYAMVGASMIYFDEIGEIRRDTNWGEVNKFDVIRACPFGHGSVMVRTLAYKNLGGYKISKELLGVEDYNLWIRLYANGMKGFNLKNHLYMFRDDRNAASRRTFIRYWRIAKLMSKGTTMLKLPFYYKMLALKPVITAILPNVIYEYFHNR